MGIVSLGNTPQLDHIILIDRFKKGEAGAFDEIVNKYQKKVYNIAYGFIGNCEDAYDISQEVFIKVFRSLGQLKNGASFFLWLKRITVNTCIDFVRQQANEQTLDEFSYLQKHYAEDNRTSDRIMETGELKKIINRAIERLPMKQRKVFVLRHYDELPLKDIAEVLGCSLGTVKAHLFRATHRLRTLLLPYLA
jgi:RNA polymerase sigma-70 factor (ECF subfamily)